MHRRGVLAALGLLPFAHGAKAQQAKPVVIGFLGSASPEQWVGRLAAFRKGLAEKDLMEGRDYTFVFRWANERNELLKGLAAELVAMKPSLLVGLGNTSSALAMKAATSEIPIVFRIAADPVEVGLVENLGRPGGNATGVTTMGAELIPKQVQLLRMMVPDMRAVAALINPTNPALAALQAKSLAAAARELGLKSEIIEASRREEFDPAFQSLRAIGASAMVITADTFFNSRNDELGKLARDYGVPTISPYREFTVAGGLMSYGGSITSASFDAGIYAGRILRGEKPAELPVQQVKSFELVVNARTAQALGVTIPPSILISAEEVID